MSRVIIAYGSHLLTVEDTEAGRVWSGGPSNLLELCQAIDPPSGYYPDMTLGIAQAVAEEIGGRVIEWVPNPPYGLPPCTVY